MKAINKIIILGMVTTLFSSCDLTLLPENAVTPENYFQNKSDLEFRLYGISLRRSSALSPK